MKSAVRLLHTREYSVSSAIVAMVVPATAGVAAVQISTAVPSTGGTGAAVAAARGKIAPKKLVWVAPPTNNVGTHATLLVGGATHTSFLALRQNNTTE